MMICVCLVCCFIGDGAYAAEPTDFWQYEKNIEQVAEPLTEQIMQAINADDYNSFKSNNSAKMKEVLPENEFKKMAIDLKGKFGDYKEKEVTSVELCEEYIIVSYKGIFSKTTDPLLIRVILMKERGKTCVAGLWFNTMKLVGHTDPNPFK